MDYKTSRKKQKHTDIKAMTSTDMFKEFNYSSLNKQVSGEHYKSMKVEPAYFINENKLQFAEGCVIKYVCRHQKKGKIKDLEKAIHYLEMIKERDYPNG